MKPSRFVGTEKALAPPGWKKPKYLLDAIAGSKKPASKSKKTKRGLDISAIKADIESFIASRAFCPTGEGGGIDNSCSSKGGGGGSAASGGGKKKNRALNMWREQNSQRLTALRSKLTEKAAKGRAERKELQREVNSLYELIDGITDESLKAKEERKAAREALRKALMDASLTPDTKSHWEKMPAGLLIDETFSPRVGAEWENDAVRAALDKVSKAQQKTEQVYADAKRHEEAVASRREAILKNRNESSKAMWQEIGKFGEEQATSDPVGGMSKEKFDQSDKFFDQRVANMYVDARTTQEAEKTFKETTKKDVEVFLAASVTPTSMAAQSVANSVTVIDPQVERAYASKNEVWVYPNVSAGTYAHELGHVIEHGDPDVLSAAIAFREARCQASADWNLAEKFPDSGYKNDEVGNRDNFEQATRAVYAELFQEGRAQTSAAYIGKVYRDSRDPIEPFVEPKIRATEIVSMGMEMLYHAPDRFAEADPEYFDFMVGIVSGSASRIKKSDVMDLLDDIKLDLPKKSGPRDGDGDGIVNEEEKNKNKQRKK